MVWSFYGDAIQKSLYFRDWDKFKEVVNSLRFHCDSLTFVIKSEPIYNVKSLQTNLIPKNRM